MDGDVHDVHDESDGGGVHDDYLQPSLQVWVVWLPPDRQSWISSDSLTRIIRASANEAEIEWTNFVVELISSRAVKYNKQNGSPTDLVDLTPLEMSWTATIDSRMKVIFMIDQSER